jgi:hypothetical protein
MGNRQAIRRGAKAIEIQSICFWGTLRGNIGVVDCFVLLLRFAWALTEVLARYLAPDYTLFPLNASNRERVGWFHDVSAACPRTS